MGVHVYVNEGKMGIGIYPSSDNPVFYKPDVFHDGFQVTTTNDGTSEVTIFRGGIIHRNPETSHVLQPDQIGETVWNNGLFRKTTILFHAVPEVDSEGKPLTNWLETPLTKANPERVRF